MKINLDVKKAIGLLIFCLILFLSAGMPVLAETYTQPYHCCTPCFDVTAEAGKPENRAEFAIDAQAKCRAHDTNCSPLAESGSCTITTGLETTASALKCAEKYPKGQGEGGCMAPTECNEKKWGGPVQVVGGQELCEVNGQRCCVWTKEGGSGAAEKPSGQSAEQLQTTAEKEFNVFKVSGNTAGAATLIGRAVTLLMAFMGSIALVLYIYAGILWMTASGDKQRISRAQQILVWTTFGAVVMLGSYILADFIFKNVIK